jgi:hypothetical protein
MARQGITIDFEHHYMSVKTLINRSTQVYRELVALEGTPRWRSFIRNAYRVGLPVILFVQTYYNGGCSSQVHEEVEDVDEGEGGEEGKMLKNVNNKRRKKGILRLSRHLEVMLSLVLLMREKKTQR